MLIEIRNIPPKMFLQELRQVIQQFVRIRNFFAQPVPRKYNQFEEKDESQKKQRRQYTTAFVDFYDMDQARRFVNEFNCKQINYKNSLKTTNYNYYKDHSWNLLLVDRQFEEVYNTQQVREEERNEILQKELFEVNQMHQQFLSNLKFDQKQQKKASEQPENVVQEQENELSQENINFLIEFKQKHVFQTKQGECTFFDLL